MNKIISTILLMVMAFIANAQNSHLLFKGIEMDGTVSEFVKKLEAKGYTTSVEIDKGAVLTGEFAGENAEIFVMGGKDENVWRVVVKFDKKETWSALKLSYLSYKKALTKKYGEGECYEFFKPPYYDGDGYELTALKLDKCTFLTYFKTENGGIGVEINSDNYAQITYEDEENVKLHENKKEQMKYDDL